MKYTGKLYGLPIRVVNEDGELIKIVRVAGKPNVVLVVKTPAPPPSTCDVCGSNDTTDAPHMGINCNRCHPL